MWCLYVSKVVIRLLVWEEMVGVFNRDIILIFVGQSFQGFLVNIARGLVVNEQ
jgi:hypothetical protein